MKSLGQIGLILIILTTWTLSSCKKTDKVVTSADSVWINFLTRLENKDVDFLIKNSLGTIQCVDCNIKSDRKTEFFNSDLVFNQHLDELTHLKSIKDREFTTYTDNESNLIRVNYQFPVTLSQDHGYNLIFTFVKVDGRYLFAGMFTT